jgi:tetratricopeptide (TPR) repeat protein
MRAGLGAAPCLLAAAWLLPAGPASAQPEGPDLEAAKQHYQKGESAAAGGEWKTAAREYGAAYEITRDPVLFFKIAESNQNAGDCAAAIVYFRRYLREAPNVEPFRATTEEKIRECEERQADERREEDTATDPDAAAGVDFAPDPAPGALPPSFVDDEPSWQRTAAWASVGGFVAFTTIGAVLGLSARSRAEDLDNLADFRDSNGNPATYTGATRERYEDLIDEGEQLERFALIAFGAAGVAAGAAVLFFVLDATRADDEAVAAGSRGLRVAPAIGADALGVTAGWTF